MKRIARPITVDSSDSVVRPVPAPDLLMEALLRIAPRVAMTGSAMWWADGRGLPEQQLAERLCSAIRSVGGHDVRAGLAHRAVTAEVAARHAIGEASSAITRVPTGEDRTFLAPFPLTVLGPIAEPDPLLLPLLTGLGIETCGELAALGREEVEVRCGIDGVRLWQLARGEDRRRPFGAMPRSLPRASCTWTDYALRDGERMLFVVHRLLERITTALHDRGAGAQALTLRFTLANRQRVEQTVRAARATADRGTWMRLIRTTLETLRFPDAVTGIAVRVRSATALLDQQGDIFDRGFATAGAVEQAVAQLLDTCGADIVAPTRSAHPLLERRIQWRSGEPVIDGGRRMIPHRPSFTLQLLPYPRRIQVVTGERRDHAVPLSYREGEGDVSLLTVTGPDRIDGGVWEHPSYVREYFQCVDGDGRLVLLVHDPEGWFLQGWWD